MMNRSALRPQAPAKPAVFRVGRQIVQRSIIVRSGDETKSLKDMASLDQLLDTLLG